MARCSLQFVWYWRRGCYVYFAFLVPFSGFLFIKSVIFLISSHV